jgi:hypothetical protein
MEAVQWPSSNMSENGKGEREYQPGSASPADALAERVGLTFNRLFRTLRFLGAGAAIIAVIISVCSLVVTAVNASAIRRQTLQQGAAAQIRMIFGEAPMVLAKATIDENLSRREDAFRVWDFSAPNVDKYELQLKQILNSLETTAGLVHSRAIDANIVCDQLAEYYFAFGVGVLGVDGHNTLETIGTKIIPDSRPDGRRLFKKQDYQEIRWLIKTWFRDDPRWFATDDYDAECAAVAPPLGFFDDLRQWL